MSTSAEDLERFGHSGEPERPGLKLVETTAPEGAFFILDGNTEPDFNKLRRLVEEDETSPATLVFSVLQENGLLPNPETLREIQDERSQLTAKEYLDDGELLHLSSLEDDLEPVERAEKKIATAIDYYHAHYFEQNTPQIDKIDVEIYDPTEMYNDTSFLDTFIKLRQQLQRNSVRRLSPHAQTTLREAEQVARLLVKDEIEAQS